MTILFSSCVITILSWISRDCRDSLAQFSGKTASHFLGKIKHSQCQTSLVMNGKNLNQILGLLKTFHDGYLM